MNIDFKKTSHIVFFGSILPIFSLGLAWCFSKFIPNPPFWLETISPIYAYGLLFALFDKYLWHWEIFKTFGIVLFPDLRGRWKGTLRSSYKIKDKNVVIPFCLEIDQSFSKIRVRAYYEKSQSESSISSFSDSNGDIFLFYTYDNEPNSLKVGTMQNHKGTAKLRYLSRENKLIGMYFNSMGNQGELSLKYSGSQFFYRFNEKE